MITTANMSLTSWPLPDDYFSRTELADNWDKVDKHDHTTGKGLQIPAGGLASSAVTTASIAAGAVTASKIANDAIDSARLSSGSVGSSEIATLPTARVYNSAAISIATGGFGSALTFNSERWDSDSIHSTSVNPSRLTAPVDGLYLINGSVQFAANATGYRSLWISYNGTSNIGQTTVSNQGADVVTIVISTVWKLVATEYVQLFAFQNSSGALNVTSVAALSPEFSLTWLSKG